MESKSPKADCNIEEKVEDVKDIFFYLTEDRKDLVNFLKDNLDLVNYHKLTSALLKMYSKHEFSMYDIMAGNVFEERNKRLGFSFFPTRELYEVLLTVSNAMGCNCLEHIGAGTGLAKEIFGKLNSEYLAELEKGESERKVGEPFENIKGSDRKYLYSAMGTFNGSNIMEKDIYDYGMDDSFDKNTAYLFSFPLEVRDYSMSKEIARVIKHKKPKLFMVLTDDTYIERSFERIGYKKHILKPKVICRNDTHLYDFNNSSSGFLLVYVREDINVDITQIMKDSQNVFQTERDNLIALANKMVERGKIHRSILFAERKTVKRILTEMDKLKLIQIPLTIDNLEKIDMYVGMAGIIKERFGKFPNALDKGNNLEILGNILNRAFYDLPGLKKEGYLPEHINDSNAAYEFMLADYSFSNKEEVGKLW